MFVDENGAGAVHWQRGCIRTKLNCGGVYFGGPKKKSLCWKVEDPRENRDAVRRTAPELRAT